MKLSRQLLVVIALGSALLLSACGGGSNSSSEELVELNSPPELNAPTVLSGSLTQATPVAVERYVKNGIYASTLVTNGLYGEVASPVSSPVTSDDSFSQTNTIEIGVDEADRIKYDGEFMYVAQAQDYSSGASQPLVRVLRRQSDGGLEALDPINPGENVRTIDGLYQYEQKLTVIGSLSEYSWYGFLPSPYAQFTDTVSVVSYDTSSPSEVQLNQGIEIEGSLISSRRVDDYLYVVSTYTPQPEEISLPSGDDEDLVSFYNSLVNTPNDQLVPIISIDGQQRSLHELSECYISEQATSADGFAQFVNVTRINLAANNDVSSLCFSLPLSTLYMSTDNLYLVANTEANSQSNGSTILHKIELETFDYAASGEVSGTLGWRSNPLFRLSEHNDILRIVTSDYSESDPTHQLHMLEQQDTQLNTIATLPNSQRPEPIGKPNEDIYAVRFFGDEAYIVTFEQIDPLYVISLADASDPAILGSLEIPGFSSYIYPMENGYLLGVGQQVSALDLPSTGEDSQPILVPDGLKISLFDVTDPSEPLELTSLVLDNSYTPVEYNYKALSVLNTDGKYQFAMPIERWGSLIANSDVATEVVSNNGLLLLEADTLDSVPELKQIKVMSVLPNNEFYYSSLEDRSIIVSTQNQGTENQGTQVYYLHGNSVWLGLWDESNDLVLGPF